MAETFHFLTLYSTDTSCDINTFECIFNAHWMCNFIAIPTFCTANRWHWRDLCSSQPGSFQSLFPLLSSSLLQLSCLFKGNWLISFEWSLWSTISMVHILCDTPLIYKTQWLYTVIHLPQPHLLQLVLLAKLTFPHLRYFKSKHIYVYRIISIIQHLCTQRTGQFTDIFKQQWDVPLVHTLKICNNIIWCIWYVKK